MRRFRRSRISVALLAALSASSCVADAPTGPTPREPTDPVELRIASGNNQTGVVTAPLGSPLVVRVVNANGTGLQGVQVQWTVSSSGGSVNVQSSTTDAAGETRNDWTLPVRAGSHTVTASAQGLTSVTFGATAVATAPSRLDKVIGDAQSAEVGTTLRDSLIVAVSDVHGNPVAGQPVTWAVTAGGGALSAAQGTTNTSGLAKVGLTLGTAAGETRVEVRSGTLTPVVFRATATAGAAAGVALVSGDAQTGTVGASLASPLVVRVTDAAGNPRPGIGVTWQVIAGGGSVSPAVATTDESGLARGSWTLGTAAGTQRVRASAAGGSVDFTATAAAGPVAAVAKVSGDGQTGTVGAPLADSLAVRVTDAAGNPVSGVTVTWAATRGGGSVAPATSTTDASGIARARWTLGSAAGANTATASVPGGHVATFTATASAGAATGLVVVAGNAQTGTAGAPLGDSLVVRAVDAGGNPVAGVTVTWTVATGGGAVSPASAVTRADGTARTRWTLGGTPGAQSVSASAPGLPPVTFRATATPAVAAVITRVAGDGQSAAAGTALADSLAVRVTDASGNPLAGQTVVWSVQGGGGSLSPASVVTDANGIARVRWTLGPAVAAQFASATTGRLTPVAFSAMATAPPVATVTVSPALASIQAGSTLTLTATARDTSGNTLTGRAVAWSSSDTTKARVSSSGVVTAVAPGTAVITATSEGKSGTAEVTVTAVSAMLELAGGAGRGTRIRAAMRAGDFPATR